MGWSPVGRVNALARLTAAIRRSCNIGHLVGPHQTHTSKNEGASGDVDENKDTVKKSRQPKPIVVPFVLPRLKLSSRMQK
jgi:hypothetical protein